jgi:hypothetical protein
MLTVAVEFRVEWSSGEEADGHPGISACKGTITHRHSFARELIQAPEHLGLTLLVQPLR